MEIPIVIHKDRDSVYGVIVPDIPGCFSWGDTVEHALQNTRQAILIHVATRLEEGLPVEITPSRIEILNTTSDYAGAYLWAVVDVDISTLETSPGARHITRP